MPDSCCLEFSESCGLHAPGTWWKAVSPRPGGGGPASLPPGWTLTRRRLLLFQPCYETVKMWLQENLLAVGVFGLCTALVQVRRDCGLRPPLCILALTPWGLLPQAEVGFMGNGQGHLRGGDL